MKKLLLMLCMVVGIGMYSMAKPTTWESKPTNAAGYDSALEGSSSTTTKIPTGWWIDKTANTKWDLTAKYASGGYYSRGTNGLTFGSGNAAIQTVTLETSAFPGTITNVTINGVSTNVSSSKKGNVTATVTVGTETFTATTSSNNTATAKDFVFTGSASGKITIVLTQAGDAGRQLNFKGLAVTYDTDGGDNPPVTTTVTPPTITISGEKQGNDYLVGATATISAETEMIQYTLDGTTPTTENGELYTEPIVLDKAQKYTIKAIALDDDFNASEVKALEVNIVEKIVTPPAGDTGTVVFIADGYTYTGTADIKVTFSGTQTSGKTIADQTWIAGDICALDFTATSQTTSYVTGSACRWYKGDGIKITPKTGYKVTGLKMVSGTGDYSVCTSNGTRLNNLNNISWTRVSTTEATWTGSIDEKGGTFTNTAQIRFQYLEVTYEKEQVAPVVDKPVITITGEKSGDDYLIGATASISAPNASYIFYTTDGSDPKADGNTAVKEVEGTSVDLGTLALGETTIKAYIWDADANSGEVETITVNVVKKPAGISWSSDQCKIYLGEEPYTFPTLNNPNNLKISYSIPEADAAIATIDKETGEITIVGKGSTTVRATYTSTDDSEFAGSWVQYTLTVAERAAGESKHATSYMFNFNETADWQGLGSYGMKLYYTQDQPYEPDTDNPVTKIIRKGVTLDFVLPDYYSSKLASYRIYQGTDMNALRVYDATLKFSVPAPGRITKVVFHNGGNNKWGITEVSAGDIPKGFYYVDEPTWTTPEDESLSEVWFKITDQTQFSGITVYYDLAKPAMPYVVSETADAIVVECDDWCELHYTKKPESASKAPSRAQLNDGTIEDTDEWYNHGSYQITIDKNNTVHQDRGYSFIANHAETGLKSDALNLYVGSDGTLTGVEGISAEADADAPVEFYDLQGRMVANPQGGIFIRRQGSKVTKVAM